MTIELNIFWEREPCVKSGNIYALNFSESCVIYLFQTFSLCEKCDEHINVALCAPYLSTIAINQNAGSAKRLIQSRTDGTIKGKSYQSFQVQRLKYTRKQQQYSRNKLCVYSNNKHLLSDISMILQYLYNFLSILIRNKKHWNRKNLT